MLEFRGKYNTAHVMINEVDETTVKQIYQFLNHPAFANTYIAIMPDCHAGKGAVIGFTMKMNDYVIPNVVGVDIGCGIESYCLGKIDIDYPALDKFIRANIPSGYNAHNLSGINACKHFLKYNADIVDFFHLKDVVLRIGLEDKLDRILGSVGTLGGGNHFIEIDEDPEGRKWLTVHSGSRNFGLQIAQYHQNKAKELMKKMFIGDAYKNLEFLPLDNGGARYLDDMYIAQKYAELNRYTMLKIILEDFFKDTFFAENCHVYNISKGKSESVEYIKTVHNYINFNDGIIRKGAISAHEGERILIPFNMRDGIAVCRGRGSSKYNFSAPHGAGRILSRSKAKETLSMDEFKASMQGIYTTSVHESTLDESPMAYKDKDLIIKNIHETADMEFFMKPVYNFKAS